MKLLKNNSLKFKTQGDEVQSSMETLQKNLDNKTHEVERMKKIRDDDVVCFA